MVDGKTMDSADNSTTFAGYPVPAGTLTQVEITRSDSDSTSIEVLNNGSVIYTLATAVSGRTSSGSISVSVSAGLISVRNISTGNIITEPQAVLTIEPS
jgi:hypothetical protein